MTRDNSVLTAPGVNNLNGKGKEGKEMEDGQLLNIGCHKKGFSFFL